MELKEGIRITNTKTGERIQVLLERDSVVAADIYMNNRAYISNF
jgi:hypothetical protein